MPPILTLSEIRMKRLPQLLKAQLSHSFAAGIFITLCDHVKAEPGNGGYTTLDIQEGDFKECIPFLPWKLVSTIFLPLIGRGNRTLHSHTMSIS